MRAVLIAAGAIEEGGPLNERVPSLLLPLVDRPFIQHVVEHIVDRGVDRIHFVLNHLPDQIESFLGDGVRWGAKFHFHLSREAGAPYGPLRDIAFESNDEKVLFGHADRLPALFAAGENESDSECVYFSAAQDKAGAGPWTGWARLRASTIKKLAGSPSEAGVVARLAALNCQRRAVAKSLSVLTYSGLLQAQRQVLSGEFDGLLATGREVEPGVRLSGTSQIHPGAKLIAPVYVGENCRVMQGAVVGPNAVIAKDAVLDEHCVVANSLVCPGTYIGAELELNDSIAEKNLLTNVRLHTAMQVADDFLVGNTLHSPARGFLRGQLSRLSALLLFLLGSPVLAAAVLLKFTRRESSFSFRSAVRLPADENPAAWRSFRLASLRPAPGRPTTPLHHFICEFLPGLWSVVRGDLALVGLPPRSAAEIGALSAEWRASYLRGKAGLVTEATAQRDPLASDDERQAAEMIYLANETFAYDMSLLAKYLGRVALSCVTRSHAHGLALDAPRAANGSRSLEQKPHG